MVASNSSEMKIRKVTHKTKHGIYFCSKERKKMQGKEAQSM